MTWWLAVTPVARERDWQATRLQRSADPKGQVGSERADGQRRHLGLDTGLRSAVSSQSAKSGHFLWLVVKPEDHPGLKEGEKEKN